MLVGGGVCARARINSHQHEQTSLTNYLLCHEILEIVFVLGWCLLVWSVHVRARAHTNTHRVHLPTLGLDGQVYVCMCMGRYSV